MAEAIVSLGDEAGCVFLVGPQALAVVINLSTTVFLVADDLLSSSAANLSTFATRLQGHGLNHPNVTLALGLYGRLALRSAAYPHSGFTGVGKTQEQIAEFFVSPSNPETSKPPTQ